MQCVRNVSSLNHLRHVGSVLSCAAHVNGKGAIQSSDTLMIQEVKRVAARSTRGGNFSSVGLREETLPEQKSRWLGNPAADVLRVPRSWPRAYPADGNCELSSMLTFVRVARRTVESAFDIG